MSRPEAREAAKYCQGIYIPWVCGRCRKLEECRPRQVSRNVEERWKSVRL